MIAIDLRTVILMSSVMPGLMSIVLFSLKKSFPSNIRGVGHWAAGSFVISVAAILLALRGAIPDWLSIVGANVAMILGAGLWMTGSELFFARRPSRSLLVILLCIGTAGLSALLWIHPDVAGRTIVISAILALLYGAQSRMMLGFGRQNYYTAFLGAVFVIQSLSTVVRCITSFFPAWSSAGLFTRDTIQTVYLITGSFSSLLATVGFVLVATSGLRMQLERQSFTDPLTGLLNRRAFSGAWQKERERMVRAGGSMAMLVVDLDHFKAINDRHGHEVGDRVLMDFSERVAGMLLPQHHLARWGGEEFAVLLPGLDADEALQQAEAIRLKAQQKEDASLPVYTCSIGVACMSAADATLEQLTRAADEALYRAKRAGRNRVIVTDELLLL
jgi:diguanylate cyclase (GGDEF)-like protein